MRSKRLRIPAAPTQYADKLAALVPGAGHLVHMPGHIYLRTGRYNDASVANENADQGRRSLFHGRRRRRQHDVPGRLLPSQHPFLRRLGVDGGTAGRRAQSGRRGARQDARRHAAGSGDGRDGPAHEPDAALYQGALRHVGRRARRAGAAGQSAVHVGDVACGARSGARGPGAASRRPRPSAPRSPR